MQVKAESLDRKLTLRLSGELDHHAARPLMQRIAQEIELALPLEDPRPLPFHSIARRVAPNYLAWLRRKDRREI